MNAHALRNALLCIALALPGGTAVAQPAWMGWLSGRRPEEPKTSLLTEMVHYCRQAVEDQDESMSYQEYRAAASIPLAGGEKWDLLGDVSVAAMDFETDAILPDTLSAFPSHLWDVEIGAAYRYWLDNGQLLGARFAVGSAGDKPFAGWDETVLSLNGFWKIPHGANAWYLLLNWSTNREFLNYVPIPGFAYQFEPVDDLRMFLGVPFSSVTWKPDAMWTLRGSYALLHNIHTRISFEPIEGLSFYGGYDWRNRQWFRHDRDDDDDRLQLYDMRTTVGVKWEITENLFVDLAGGYAFNRFFFEEEDFDDRDENRLDLSDGPFATVRLVLEF